MYKTYYWTLAIILSFCMAGRASAASDMNIVINEIMPANIDTKIDPSWNYGGFIELYNPDSVNRSLTGLWLSDDADNLKKWQLHSNAAIRAKGFYVVWFGHNDKYFPNQCPFDLDLEGGEIYVSDRYGNLITSQAYPAAIRRCSYARTTDGGDTWGWCDTPTINSVNKTMGATNEGSKFAAVQLAAPVVDKNGRVFTGTLPVSVNIPEGATLRFTTDGSVPTLTNGTTSKTGLFSVSKTTVYRFRLYKDGFLPSDVVTRSFIYRDYDFNIPIISVVTNRNNIFGNDYGIFVQGSGNGRSGRGQSSKCNWNMDWDRPVSFEYFDDGKEACFAQEVNMSAVGGWSRAWSPHSFKLKANKLYGLNYLPYAVFPNKPFNKNKTLHVRNGGNDNGCKMNDASIQEIVARSGIDVDCQSYIPAFVYINGSLYDILNIREPNNKHFAYANKGLKDEEMDQFEYSPDSGYVQMEGTRDAFEELYALSENAADEDNYARIKQLLDIDEFINYMAVEMYIGGGDWLNNSNNVKGYRPRTEGGKFRLVLMDLDSYGGTNQFRDLENTRWQTLDYMYDAGTSLYKEIELTTIWLNLLENESFRKQFIDTFCMVVGSVFEPSRCSSIVDELANRAYEAMSQIGESPWGSANSVKGTFSSSRQTTMINTLKSYSKMRLSNIQPVKVSLKSNIEEGRICINGLQVPTNKFDGKLFPPATVTASAPNGYKFKGWKSTSKGIQKDAFTVGSQWQYYDGGSLDGKAWYSSSYSVSTWTKGNSPLGYVEGTTWPGVTTEAKHRLSTYYMRKSFYISTEPAASDVFTLNFTVDDGCVVYINGTEVGRFNMPSGTVKYSTYASTYSDQYSFPQTMTIPGSMIKKGTNIIAVEVHNNSADSSDALWDASLSYTDYSTGSSIVSTDETYTLPSGGELALVAEYEPLSEKEIADMGVVPVRINEVSAGNSIYVNEYFDDEDWVELYNMTDKSVDLGGMYLSDNISKPLKYQFEKGSAMTVIEPFGHRIVWCDKNESAGQQLHASFKLANEDAYVVLTSEDRTWADTLLYCAHNGDMSVGRYPDGAGNVYVMNRPTIGQSNCISTYDSIHVQAYPTPDGIASPSMVSRDGDMSIAYSNGYLLIRNGQEKHVTLFLAALSGKQIVSAVLNTHDGCCTYPLSVPQGTYIAYIMDSEGRKCSVKFHVK